MALYNNKQIPKDQDNMSPTEVKAYTNDQENRIENAFEGLLDFFWPIGILLETTNSANPGNYLGGTWERYGNGRVTVGLDGTSDFNTAGKIGGAKTHVLSIDEMPKHQHNMHVSGSGSSMNTVGFTWAGSRAAGAFMETQGENEAHNNLQPYITVYRWRRTA